MNEKTILYIVKQNDTLESIAKNENTEVSEIIRLNPLSKHRLIEGQPLILLKKEIEEFEDNKISSLNRINKSKDYENIELLSLKYKELLLSLIFFEDGYTTLLSKFNEYLTSIKLNNKLAYLLKFVLDFPTYIKQKDDKRITLFQKDLKIYLSKFSEYDSYSLEKLVEYIELYVLNMFLKKSKDAELYFEMYQKELYKLISKND